MALVPEIETFLQGVPRPRSNVLNVIEDDPVERYFDLHAYYASDEEQLSRSESSVLTPGLVTDATSPSVLSDSSSAVEVSPEAHEGRGRVSTRKTLEDARMQDGNIIWPQTDPGQPPRDVVLRLPASHNKKKPRRPSSPASRHVKNPAETAQVRKVGACIKCRIEKLKCSDGGICHSCEHKYGPPLCERTCLRKTLTESAKLTTPVRYTGIRWEQEQALLRTKCAVGRGYQHVFLSFSEIDPLAPALPVIFQHCRSVSDGRDGVEVFAFPRERVPTHEQLIGWVENQIRYERSNGLGVGFESSIEAFVMAYTKAGSMLPQIGLLKKIHHMRCMYRIWRMDDLFCRTNESPDGFCLPPMIGAELRQIVRKALECLERDILGDLDKFLKPSGIPTKGRAPMWAGLWQLIFVLKDLTSTFHVADMPAHAHPDFDLCRTATEEVLVAVLSFYGSHYRQASNLQVGLDCCNSTSVPSSRMRQSLKEAFQRARLDRGAFHAFTMASDGYLDNLVKVLVVEHEVKRLTRRRNRGRAQPEVMAVASSPDMYDSGDDAMLLDL